MKTKLSLIILFFILFNSTAQNSIDSKQYKRKKTTIIKPEEQLKNIDEIKSNFEIFDVPDYEFKLNKEIISEGLNYQYYNVYKDGYMIYDTKLTLTLKDNIIKQIVHNFPENLEFNEAKKSSLTSLKSVISDYNITDSTLIYYFSVNDKKYDLVWKINATYANKSYILFVDSYGKIINKEENVRKSQTVNASVNTLYNGAQTFKCTMNDYILWKKIWFKI